LIVVFINLQIFVFRLFIRNLSMMNNSCVMAEKASFLYSSDLHVIYLRYSAHTFIHTKKMAFWCVDTFSRLQS